MSKIMGHGMIRMINISITSKMGKLGQETQEVVMALETPEEMETAIAVIMKARQIQEGRDLEEEAQDGEETRSVQYA